MYSDSQGNNHTYSLKIALNRAVLTPVENLVFTEEVSYAIMMLDLFGLREIVGKGIPKECLFLSKIWELSERSVYEVEQGE